MGVHGINIMKALLLSCAQAVCLVVLAGCAPADQPSPAAQGTGIVSLNPCLDAILVELAEPQQILALSHYSRDPGSSSIDIDVARRFAYTGGTAEEVLALKPDVVVASTFIAPPTKAALERAGIRVETFGSPSSVEESLSQISQLSKLLGGEAKGEALIERITAPPEPVSQRVSALLWQPGQIVAGETSLVAEHLEWAGFANHAAAMGLGQADHVTLEQLLADPPEVLLVAGDSAGQSHEVLDALDTTMVHPFPPRLFYCAGPSIIEARAILASLRTRFADEVRQ